jgi:peptidyl-prolyl cis-trans isomerase A (cyclophilin A)
MKIFTSFAILVLATLILTPGCGAASDDDKQKSPVVILTTSFGVIKIELDPEKAPISMENFLGYVDDGYYDGTVFHRVIPNFMVQGGGMTPDGKQKKTKGQIKNEADNGLLNDRGTVAMARTKAQDSATSQFFVNVVDNAFLNHGSRGFGYAVFGRVTEGMDVVDKIAAVKTGRGDVPVEDVLLESAKRE